MLSVAEVQNIERDFVRSCGGFWEVSEFDHKQNKISRNLIRAFKREHGSCFLGSINNYTGSPDPDLTEYRSGMVYNFQCCFAVPVYDAELVAMIRDYNNTPYTPALVDKIQAIHDRIYELGGINLRWV